MGKGKKLSTKGRRARGLRDEVLANEKTKTPVNSNSGSVEEESGSSIESSNEESKKTVISENGSSVEESSSSNIANSNNNVSYRFKKASRSGSGRPKIRITTIDTNDANEKTKPTVSSENGSSVEESPKPTYENQLPSGLVTPQRLRKYKQLRDELQRLQSQLDNNKMSRYARKTLRNKIIDLLGKLEGEGVQEDNYTETNTQGSGGRKLNKINYENNLMYAVQSKQYPSFNGSLCTTIRELGVQGSSDILLQIYTSCAEEHNKRLLCTFIQQFCLAHTKDEWCDAVKRLKRDISNCRDEEFKSRCIIPSQRSNKPVLTVSESLYKYHNNNNEGENKRQHDNNSEEKGRGFN